MNVERICFAVGDEGYCAWGYELSDYNREFLEGVDTGYFLYLAEAIGGAAEDDTEQLSALALRLAYLQGLETLFAFLGAAIQAPDFVPGWLKVYRPWHFDSLMTSIANRGEIPTRFALDDLSWSTIAKLIFSRLPEDSQEEYADQYGELWRKFASDYEDQHLRDEYNSIKHGMRVLPGGFSMSIGPEEIPGEPAPESNMVNIGRSKYGTEFIETEKMAGHGHHILTRRRRMNWHPSDQIHGLRLISYSLSNVVAFLKLVNRYVEDAEFIRPQDETNFQGPWQRLKELGVTTASFGPRLEEDSLDLDAITPEDILSMYETDEEE